jgi:hypothetical protein
MSKYLVVNGSIYFDAESVEVQDRKLESLVEKLNEKLCMTDNEVSVGPTNDTRIFGLFASGDTPTSTDEQLFKDICNELGIIAVFRFTGDGYDSEGFIHCGPDEEKSKALMRREVLDFYIEKIQDEGEFGSRNDVINYVCNAE